MPLTQKYKQQQRQVRVITNASNYLKGMYYTDTPLSEGYSKTLINFDIDSLSGKLIPRKGLQSLGVIKPDAASKAKLTHSQGYNVVVDSKVCAVSDGTEKRKINRYLQTVLYNTKTGNLNVATCDAEIVSDPKFNLASFNLATNDTYATPDPYIIPNPGIHKLDCAHNNFFKKPVGTFAFGDSYYTFVEHSLYHTTACELPSGVETYADLPATGNPGDYYVFTEGTSAGTIAYYDADGKKQIWTRSVEELAELSLEDPLRKRYLCYTRLGRDIKAVPEIELLDPSINRATLVDDKYYVCRITPQTLNPTEAASWGYNMLLDDPYDFSCMTGVDISVLGILIYNKDNKIELTPRKNQQVTLKGFYRAPSSYTSPEDSNSHVIRVLWEKRNATSASWDPISDSEVTLSATPQPFTATTTLDSEETIVRLTLLDPADVETEIVVADNYKGQAVLSVNTIGITAVSDDLANTLNLTTKVFDLKQANGMCEWENRLVVWGVPEALNTLFISDINNPTFFPYPNNIDTFTDPIISVHKYGNELLVLTTSALYRLTWDTEGTGWTHKLVQHNLHVTEADTYMSCVIKNMFFFKSGEYYYMMVPKVSAANAVRGEVAIAPISKPIEGLLDNFHNIVYNLSRTMYDDLDLTSFDNALVNYFSYIDSSKVVVNYVYDLNETIGDTESVTNSKYLYVQLIYDTDARTWSMKFFEAPHMLYASHADAIQQDRFIDLTPALDDNVLVLQYYKFQEHQDKTIQSIDSEYTATEDEEPATDTIYYTRSGAGTEESPYVYTVFEGTVFETGVTYYTRSDVYNYATPIIKNYQYFDTGNREINTELKKRFREFQFKIKNNTATNLGFYTSFIIDGSIRRDLQKYKPSYILDPVTGEAMVIIERTLDTDSMTYKTTRVERVVVPEKMLQDEGELAPTILNDLGVADQWILNQSAFPGRTLWKIRMAISGKGYTPRVILLSTNEQDFEILGHSFVYRTMNAR